MCACASDTYLAPHSNAHALVTRADSYRVPFVLASSRRNHSIDHSFTQSLVCAAMASLDELEKEYKEGEVGAPSQLYQTDHTWQSWLLLCIFRPIARGGD